MAVASEFAQSIGDASTAGLVVLDRLRYWPPGKMLWATCGHCPPRLSALADTLAARLLASGYILELRPWLAHVTLLRRVALLPQDAELDSLKSAPVRWSYRDFVLLRSRPGPGGAAYERLGRWALRDALN
jgi:2'-5' RNA ligase